MAAAMRAIKNNKQRADAIQDLIAVRLDAGHRRPCPQRAKLADISDPEAKLEAAAARLQALTRGHLVRSGKGLAAASVHRGRTKGEALWSRTSHRVHGALTLGALYTQSHVANALDEKVSELRWEGRRGKRLAAELANRTHALLGRTRMQRKFHSLYQADRCQYAVALMIMLNFITNLVEKEIDPLGTLHKSTWRGLEAFFNAFFLLELLLNMYAHWFCPFFVSGWNLFDLLVVTIGIITFFVELQGPLKLFRTLRAFRVFRLFKRVESLNKILTMVATAIPGVLNAFLVIILAISIYAMIAVEFFSSFGSSTEPPTEPPGSIELDGVAEEPEDATCRYLNVVGEAVLPLSSRRLCYGSEYYGTFSRAWISLFQVLIGDSSFEAIARPLIFGWVDYGPASSFLAASFFVSFILLNAFVLFNVFVAVLLDKMMAPEEKPDWEQLLHRLEGRNEEHAAVHGTPRPASLSALPHSAKEGSAQSSTTPDGAVLAAVLAEQRSVRTELAALARSLERIEASLKAVPVRQGTANGGGAVQAPPRAAPASLPTREPISPIMRRPTSNITA